MTSFIDFLTNLAPTGETSLIVKQKPTNQFHADGTIKCTWPAYLPTTKIKKGESWYGNTASFILDRFIDGRVSASSANCEYVLVMVLDDVGDPEKAPNISPLPPTWIMETSEGSFQWGYVFSEQPTKGDFTAAITAIADAGYTDKGATNAVRNFRLPGSVNIKPNRNNFASVLVEFHPEREYTLPEICSALNVTPAEANTAHIRNTLLADTGADDVLAWLNEQKLVLSSVNAEGWVSVVCPNHASHSDNNPEARYKPVDRSFCCYHGHCSDLTSKTFLTWVAENGGPEHSHGLRDELLAEVMSNTLSKITPSDMFSHDASDLIAEVERKEVGRVEKSAWYERFAYLQNEDAYFDMDTRREVSRRAFTAIFRHISCTSIHGNGKLKVDPATCYDENRQAHNAKVLMGLTYAPGATVIVTKKNEMYGNRWVDGRPNVSNIASGNIDLWVEHCRTLIPNEVELEHIWDVMAYKTQNPSIKINHAVLHGGDEGCGKDLMWRPFMWAVCGDSGDNKKTLDGDTMNSAWGYHLESEILVLNELKEPDGGMRRQLANRLKPVIAAPPEYLTVARKGLHPYDTLNRMFVLAFSNDPVPIQLPTQDRRWFCVWSHAPRMKGDSGKKMIDWQNSGGNARIAKWLHARDVSAFNPGEWPMMTEYKLNLVEQSMSTAEAYLVDMMRNRVGEFAKGVIGSPFHSICDIVSGAIPNNVKVPPSALLHALKEAEWVDCGRVKSRAYDVKKHIFCAPDLASWSKSDLRAMIEEEHRPNLVAVK